MTPIEACPVARHKTRTRAGSGSNQGEVLLARTLACPDYDYPGRSAALNLILCSEGVFDAISVLAQTAIPGD